MTAQGVVVPLCIACGTPMFPGKIDDQGNRRAVVLSGLCVRCQDETAPGWREYVGADETHRGAAP